MYLLNLSPIQPKQNEVSINSNNINRTELLTNAHLHNQHQIFAHVPGSRGNHFQRAVLQQYNQYSLLQYNSHCTIVIAEGDLKRIAKFLRTTTHKI